MNRPERREEIELIIELMVASGFGFCCAVLLAALAISMIGICVLIGRMMTLF